MTIKKNFFGLPVLKKNVLNIILFAIATVVSTLILTRNKSLNINKITGYILTISIYYAILFLFINQFRHSLFSITYKIVFILVAINIFLFITNIISSTSEREMLFLIPFAIIPIVIRIFYDSRMALFVLLITLMLSCLAIPDPFDFIIINFITGMTAIYTLDNVFRKARLLFTSAVVILSYCIIYVSISLIKGFGEDDYLLADFSLFVMNGVLTLLSYPLIAIFEKYFRMVSDATLLSLSDTNQPLLRKLSKEAPGSFHHSIQVATLAEEAARVIGANVLLVRAGSLYHDIGKISAPEYFTENQIDNINPHDNILPVESARVIIGHVKKGITLAKNYKLPDQIIDFIATHHGTSIAYYFYKKAIDENGEGNVSKADFSYPGPKPFSKETAVVMMADAVEASARTLSSYTEDDINNHIEKILTIQENDDQFSNVPLTYKDMSDIREVFKKALMNMYHTRIAYPERENRKEQTS